MQPNDPVIGGTVLRHAAIQSPNFVQGISGWAIKQDGTAFFVNVTITGGEFVLTDAGGTTVGTLDGTQGLVLYGNGNAGNPGFQVTPFGDVLFGGTGFLDPLTLDMSIEAGGPIIASGKDVVGLTMGSGAIDAGQHQSIVAAVSAPVDNSETAQVMLAPRAVSSNPAVSGSPEPEIWHALPTLQNGWLDNGAPYGTSNYHLELDGNSVRFSGAIKSGTKADGTLLFTLPAGYRPPATRLCVAAGANNGSFVGLTVASTGAVTCEGIGAMGAFIGLDPASFRLT